jgi:hypothetical protein
MLLVSTLHLRSLRVSELLSLIGILQGTTAARRISKYTARALWKYSLHRWKAEVGCGQEVCCFLSKPRDVVAWIPSSTNSPSVIRE